MKKLGLMLVLASLLQSANIMPSAANSANVKGGKESDKAQSLDEMLVKLISWYESNINDEDITIFREYLVRYKDYLLQSQIENDLKIAASTQSKNSTYMKDLLSLATQLKDKLGMLASYPPKHKKTIESFENFLEGMDPSSQGQAILVIQLQKYILSSYGMPEMQKSGKLENVSKKSPPAKAPGGPVIEE